MVWTMSFKRLICKHILIPFLIVVLSAMILFHGLSVSSILARPMMMVYYAFLLGFTLSLYYILFGDDR